MSIKNFRHYFFIESPWSFLVSTASLFLIIAVLFFHLFVFSFEDYFVINVVSFMSLASKTKPKVMYLGGSVLANHIYYKYYTFRPIGIGKAHWNPDNYSAETQILINKLFFHLKNQDREQAYDVMYAILGNKNGFFSENYGKVVSVVNNMIYAYNDANENNPLSEKDFLDRYKFVYYKNELDFLDKTNRGTIMSNIKEILAPKIVMLYNNDMLVERCIAVDDKINLSFQENPDLTIGLFVKSLLGEYTVVIYDSDLKTTDDSALQQKYLDLINKQQNNTTFIGKEKFGMNIVIVASIEKTDQESNIIMSPNKIEALFKILLKLKQDYPIQFRNFDPKSESFITFLKTGNTSILNKSNFPVVRYYRPSEFYKLPHDKKKFEETAVYKLIVEQSSKKDNYKSDLPFITNDDTTD